MSARPFACLCAATLSALATSASADERHYTLDEIDQMRGCIYGLLIQPNVPFRQADVEREAELRLRTYLQAGISTKAVCDKEERQYQTNIKAADARQKWLEETSKKHKGAKP